MTNNRKQSRLQPDLDRYIPAGLSWQKEAGKIGLWLGLCAAFGFFVFVLQYLPVRNDLMEWKDGQQYLIYGAVMCDFAECMDCVLWMFPVVAVACIAQAWGYYQYHREGSMSIYLMRRLPNRWELHRRCLVFPFAGLVLCVVSAFLTVVLCYVYYMIATPESCLTPGQWQKYWRFL